MIYHDSVSIFSLNFFQEILIVCWARILIFLVCYNHGFFLLIFHDSSRIVSLNFFQRILINLDFYCKYNHDFILIPKSAHNHVLSSSSDHDASWFLTFKCLRKKYSNSNNFKSSKKIQVCSAEKFWEQFGAWRHM